MVLRVRFDAVNANHTSFCILSERPALEEALLRFLGFRDGHKRYFSGFEKGEDPGDHLCEVRAHELSVDAGRLSMPKRMARKCSRFPPGVFPNRLSSGL